MPCQTVHLLTAGRVIDAPSVPAAVCEAGAARPIGLVDIAPDGLSMAYTEQIIDVETGQLERTEVVVRDLASGTEVIRVEVGGASVEVSALDWNGRHVAMALVSITETQLLDAHATNSRSSVECSAS